MVHRAVSWWAGFMMLGAAALLGPVLLVSGPAGAAACPPYGPCTQPTTVAPTTIAPSNPVVAPSSTGSASSTGPSSTGPSSTAFTGADLALMFTIGAIAIGAGGVLVLVSRRRRRSEPAYVRYRE
jgi:hypothetical protein